MTAVRTYLTAFTVYLDQDLKASVDLSRPTLPEGVEIIRPANDHDFDVAALWIDKYRRKQNP